MSQFSKKPHSKDGYHRGITHTTTQTYSLEINSPAENAIKQIVSKALAMMWVPQIPIGFWPEVMCCSTYLKNRYPHRALGGITPYEKWYGKKPFLGYLKIFGCRCYAYIEKENRQKLDAHTIECIFLGYYATDRLFAVYDVARRIILKKRDIIVFENVLGHPSMVAWGLAAGTNILGLPMDVEEIGMDSEIDTEPEIQNATILENNKSNSAFDIANLILKDILTNDTMETDIAVEDMIVPAAKTLSQRIWNTYREKIPKLSISDEEHAISKMYNLHYNRLYVEYHIPDKFDYDLSQAVNELDPTSWK